MAVQERLALQQGRFPAVGVLGHELAEVVRLLAEPLRVLVIRPQLHELVLEDGDAARFYTDDGRAGANVVAQPVEHVAEIRLGQVEHPVVIERPAAAEVSTRDDNVKAGLLQRLDRRDPDLGLEVVRERVGPEDHAPTPAVGRRPGREPGLQRQRRKGRDLAVRMNAGCELEGAVERRRLGEDSGQ